MSDKVSLRELMEFQKKKLGLYQIPISRLIPNPHNERKTWDLEKLRQLAKSLQISDGNITPGISEWVNAPENLPPKNELQKNLQEMLDDSCFDGEFMIFGGNRRLEAGKLAKLDRLDYNIYVDLTSADRLDIQFIENGTKTSIPREELATGYWVHYVTQLALKLAGPKSTKIKPIAATNYWELPKSYQQLFSIRDYAEEIGKDLATIKRAFRYQRLHAELQKKVVDGTLLYSVGCEIARIPNKNHQVSAYSALSMGGRKLTPKRIRAHIASLKGKEVNPLEVKVATLESNYYVLRQSDEVADVIRSYVASIEEKKKAQTEVKLKLHSADNRFKGLIPKINDLNRILKKIYFMAEKDSDFVSESGFQNGHKLSDIISRLTNSVSKLMAYYDEQDYTSKQGVAWLTAWEKYNRSLEPRESAHEQIAKIFYEDQDKENPRINLISKYYDPAIPLDNIHVSKNNPRKTFNEKAIEDIANTIKRKGILQQITVRPSEIIDGEQHYEIVVGHTRYKGARKARDDIRENADEYTTEEVEFFETIDAQVCDMDERTAAIYRAEEDLHEVVQISERAENSQRMFELYKEQHPNASISEFARHAKISSDRLYEDLKYASLDVTVKAMHEYKLIGKDVALELAHCEDVEKRFTYAFAASALGLKQKEVRNILILDGHIQDQTEVSVVQPTLGGMNLLAMKREGQAKQMEKLKGRVIDMLENQIYELFGQATHPLNRIDDPKYIRPLCETITLVEQLQQYSKE